MLPRNRKVRDRKLFGVTYRSGKRFYGKFFSLFVCALDSADKFACVVSSKVSKRAVVRNKLRRRAYDIIQRLLPETRGGNAAVFVFKSGAEKLTYDELARTISRALRSAGLIK